MILTAAIDPSWVAAAGALATLLVAITGLVVALRGVAKTDQVHTIVNGERTAGIARAAQLSDALTAAGMPVPEPPAPAATAPPAEPPASP